MGKEKENSVPPEFIAAAERFTEIAERMDKAWRKMVEIKPNQSNQYSIYKSMGEKRIRELMSGKRPKKGEEHIAEYLRALEDFLS